MIVTQEQLAEALDFDPKQGARIEKCLKDQGIAVFYGRGGRIWTTTECIAKAAEGQLVSPGAIKIDGPTAA